MSELLTVLTVEAGDSARDALGELQAADQAVAVVLGPDATVVGTVSDAGIRKAALAGRDLAEPVTAVLDADPAVVGPDVPTAELVEVLVRRSLPAMVVVAPDGRPVGLRRAVDVPGASPPPAIAVVLAGGRGQRLAPLTDKVPKPLLTVGRTTIIERLLESLARAGIVEVYLAVNYKAEVFEERLGDGSAYGVELRYLREHKPLHTAGPLSLLPEPPAGPLLVANADQVTALDFARLVEFHRQEAAAITIGTFGYDVQVPYGVLRLEEGRVSAIEEKPVLHSTCNAGVYVVEPSAVRLVPRNTFFGMPSLVEAVLAESDPVRAFPILETFIDIGTREELDRALLWFATGEEV